VLLLVLSEEEESLLWRHARKSMHSTGRSWKARDWRQKLEGKRLEAEVGRSFFVSVSNVFPMLPYVIYVLRDICVPKTHLFEDPLMRRHMRRHISPTPNYQDMSTTVWESGVLVKPHPSIPLDLILFFPYQLDPFPFSPTRLTKVSPFLTHSPLKKHSQNMQQRLLVWTAVRDLQVCTDISYPC
jgi:hypothetical protein